MLFISIDLLLMISKAGLGYMLRGCSKKYSGGLNSCCHAHNRHIHFSIAHFTGFDTCIRAFSCRAIKPATQSKQLPKIRRCGLTIIKWVHIVPIKI
jgi:hypothetical protein